jgi:hypothetical protein
MSHTKQTSNRKRRACAVPLLGAAGLSLSLASGAPAATEGPAADMPRQNTVDDEGYLYLPHNVPGWGRLIV